MLYIFLKLTSILMEHDHAFITDKADLRNTRVGSKREICLFPRWRRKGGPLTCGCEVPAQLRKDESENQKGAGFSLKSRPATRKSPRHGVTPAESSGLRVCAPVRRPPRGGGRRVRFLQPRVCAAAGQGPGDSAGVRGRTVANLWYIRHSLE